MAIYEINGSTYELPDSLTGDALSNSIKQLSALPPTSQPEHGENVKKFLSFLSKAEGADYSTIVGGGKFTDFSKHPNIAAVKTADGVSSAAGRYQITKTTYDDIAPKIGVTDFSPESQDKIAIELLRRKGALEDVQSGNYKNAVNKLGSVWASLPSSTYKQFKRSKEWTDAELSKLSPISTANANDEVVPQKQGGATLSDLITGKTPQAYKPFAKVRDNIDPKTLNDDYDWLMASYKVYQLTEGKPFQGSTQDLAEWGKDKFGWFNSNIPAMSYQANEVIRKGSQEQKEAFLYMMNTYDNTNFSWEGTKRWAKGIATDPTTYVGLESLGLGKAAATMAAKEAAKTSLMKAIGRTGLIAGAEGGVIMGVDNTIRQGVEVDAGAKKEFSTGELVKSVGTGVAAGVVLGTSADLAFQKISKLFKKDTPTEETPSVKAQDQEISGEPNVSPKESPKVSPMASNEATGASGVVRANETTGLPEIRVDEPNVPPVRQETTPSTSSILTDEEIAQATSRQQAGRKAEDEIIPKFPEDAPEVKVDVPEINTGLRTTRVEGEAAAKLGTAELNAHADTIVKQLNKLDNTSLEQVLEQFRTGKYSLEEQRVIAKAVQTHSIELRLSLAETLKQKVQLEQQKTLNEAQQVKIKELEAKAAQLEERLAAPSLADDAYGSFSGTLLQDRQNTGLPGAQKVSVESIMAETGATRQEAEVAYIKAVEDSQRSAEAKAIQDKYDSEFDAAVAKGDFQEATKIAAMKHRHLESLADERAKSGGTYMQRLNEFAISNVFTIKTVLVNLVPSLAKTIVIPALKAILNNPLERATRVEMVASYSAMKATLGAARKAAWAAYKYEQALLTRDGARLLEGELAMTGKLGGALRFFPRILNATDEFLSQINYSSFIAGRSGAEAAIKGAEKGLKGADLETYIKSQTTRALNESLKPAQSEELIRPIINKGVNLRLSGEELAAYVEREAAKNPEALRHGNDEDALNFARDVLYKRRFSGEGTASAGAQAYEQFTNRVPSFRFIMGQLFFRTPIRVFEEGIRLTPGIQILAPKFLSDLSGKNGQLRMIRAQGEALTSLAIAGSVLSLYGQGRITGDGAYDTWKQARSGGDTGKQPLYTIKLSEGSYWSYRNLDPIATPVKIMINGMERMDKLRVRQAQGEFVDAAAYQQAMAYITVGTTAIAAALRDANLVAGINGTIKIATDALDPEANDGALIKLFGEKLNLLVPNTLHKIAKDNDPTIKDPVTFWQVVEERLKSVGFDKEDIKSSYSYDMLGHPRQLADTGSLWNMFSTTSQEELARGRTSEELYVLGELDRLSKVTGATFVPPLKNALIGDVDLRTIMASDGKQTLYDKWQAEYSKLPVAKALAPILRAPLPDGTFKYKAARVQETQEVIKEFQQAAFLKMMVTEKRVVDEYQNNVLSKARGQAGQFDYGRTQ